MDTFGIENKTSKKKSSKTDVVVTNPHGVQMKGIMVIRKTNGKFKDVFSLSKPKEFKHKNLNKEVDHITFSMSGLTNVISEPLWNIEANKEPGVTCGPSVSNINIKSSLIKCPYKVIQGKPS